MRFSAGFLEEVRDPTGLGLSFLLLLLLALLPLLLLFLLLLATLKTASASAAPPPPLSSSEAAAASTAAASAAAWREREVPLDEVLKEVGKDTGSGMSTRLLWVEPPRFEAEFSAAAVAAEVRRAPLPPCSSSSLELHSTCWLMQKQFEMRPSVHGRRGGRAVEA